MKKCNARALRTKLKSLSLFLRLSRLILLLSVGVVLLFSLGNLLSDSASASDERTLAIENALYTKAEFFGAQAIVPLPTSEARKRLAKIEKDFPGDAEIIKKLAELDEKLGELTSAEQNLQKLVELKRDDLTAFENLAEFYNRRGLFEKSAEVTEKMLAVAPTEKRNAIFGKLIRFARVHDLEKYQNAAFYQTTAKTNPSAFSVIETLIDTLEQQENYAEALKLLRDAKNQFPKRREVFFQKEIELLTQLRFYAEVEKLYLQNFDPFWDAETNESFYGFLDSQNRLRAYGKELKDEFKRNPADFNAAVRLNHYRQNDGVYGNDSSAEIIQNLEKSRAAAHVEWKAEELIAVARILLAENESDAASRFLYTLHLQGKLESKSELRAQISYQLFRLFANAENERIALSNGNLQFYKDIATADTNPGITTAVLSLIFADAHPQNRLDEKGQTAARLFNRAAAYRIFLEFKEEYPDAPELAQMYLDLVHFYTLEKETEIAANLLAEFEQKYEKSGDYADAALKLADAFIVINRREKEREIYQKLLDYLGKQERFAVPTENLLADKENSSEDEKTLSLDENSSENDEAKKYPKLLSNETPEITYQKILKRLIDALAKENKTAEILAVYSNEIGKYPHQEWLYEERLAWLGQTNLAEEELKVYRQALEKFPTRNWQDKLARWFLRRSRKQEFAEFSKDLVEKLSDRETEKYLSEFTSAPAAPNDFDAQLYLNLYKKAHERFPHNLRFIKGLLNFYQAHKRMDEWRALSAEYYFEFAEVRVLFLNDLAMRGELRARLQQARSSFISEEITLEKIPYALFRADSAAHLAGFEEAVGAYRRLNELYPNTPEFEERLINFTRSFGQKNRETLRESASFAYAQSENAPSSAAYRTRSGELLAELGDYKQANEEWRKLPQTARGTNEIHLETATIQWDYFQYDEALRTIKTLREKNGDDSLYAFQTGAIWEAKHDLPQAIGEYLKTLGTASEGSYADYSDGDRAVNRLVKLSARSGVAEQINAAFEGEKQKREDDLAFVFAFAEYLEKIKQTTRAKMILKNAIPKSRDENTLSDVNDFLINKSDFDGSELAVKRLANVAKNSKDAIGYRLRLAENYAEENRPGDAKNVLSDLLANFPTNYGVLSETAEIFWRTNLRDDAINTLRLGVARGKGEYRYIFSRNLAVKLVAENRLPEAETLLYNLHETDKSNTEVFRELANIYVRTGNSGRMRKTFAETVKAINAQNIETEEKRTQIAEFRRRMIEAFTKLEDYDSAVAQHIEIINRDADEEENVAAAIDYVKRYGGTEKLLEYYRKTAAEAYKNHRWNAVLAQIYEANGDAENAAQNYRLAIANQPEMTEFYVALAGLEIKRKNYDSALENVNKVLELTNEEQQFIRLKIEILEKAGRRAEADAEREKLPAEQRPKLTISEQFAAARNAPETEKATENYRQAFDALFENPYSHELRAADVAGFVQSLRSEENLTQIAEKLWLLREKLIEETEAKNSIDAGKARDQLKILDGAMPEAIGKAARNYASSEETGDLQNDLSRRLDENFSGSDRHATLLLVQNIAFRAGFGVLEEKILSKNFEFARGSESYHVRLKTLLDFYNERGMYRKTAEILEKERGVTGSNRDYLKMSAENARILGDAEKELAALREIYRQTNDDLKQRSDETVSRYLEMLYQNGENGKAELGGLSNQSSPYQFQLINFLLAKGENVLAHRAIENAPLQPKSWKLGRDAETSLALREYGAETECYFCDALEIATIGELVRQKTDKETHLTGDDWFRLSREYGEWLLNAPAAEMRVDAKKYLPAMTENFPKSSDEQSKLGVFYLEKSDAKNALEHLWLAAEIAPEDRNIKANLGAAYFLMNDRKKAFEIWDELLTTENSELGDIEFYFQTLQKYKSAAQAREKVFKNLVGKLEGLDYYSVEYERKEAEEMRGLIRIIAASFENENAKLNYFKKLCEVLKQNSFLPEMLINESLIERENLAVFYQMLIARSSASNDYERDYDYEAASQKSWNRDEAEEILEQENDYEIKEPTGVKIIWQQKYLYFLLEQKRLAEAKNTISQIENSVARRFARPVWLRLAKLQLQIPEGGAAQTVIDAKRFVGIEIGAETPNVRLPDIERLNEVLKLFRDEQRDAEARELLEAFYARMLALGNFETTNFIGLARVFFEKSDAEKGLKILQTMNDFADDERRETAQAEISSWETVKARAVSGAKSTELAEPKDINAPDSLRLAAETAAEFGRIDAAISYRQILLETTPKDTDNKIKLARLFAARGGEPEAVTILAEILNDRNSSKTERWQSVWAAREIVKDKRNLVNALTSADGEIKNAVEILANDSIEIKTENPGAQFWFFIGLTAKSFRQNDFAVNAFTQSLLAEKGAEPEKIFAENSALQQLIEIYITENQPQIALKLAEIDKSAKPDVLLDLLSKNAQNIGDFQKAIEFEKAKKAENISTERVKKLEFSAARVNQKATNFAVDAEKTRRL